jgi:hypothetical protein
MMSSPEMDEEDRKSLVFEDESDDLSLLSNTVGDVEQAEADMSGKTQQSSVWETLKRSLGLRPKARNQQYYELQQRERNILEQPRPRRSRAGPCIRYLVA